MTDRSRRFHVCVHDATPRYARETRALIQALAPHIGRRLSFGVVPDWHGEWPLAAHPDYGRLIRDSAEELLLHGYFHRRQRGRGLVAMFADSCDEMNGLDVGETQRLIERGQHVFEDAFGIAARGFVAPGWQCGCVRPAAGSTLGVDHVLGFFSLQSFDGRKVPLVTWTWDCGRWGWLGRIGHGVGRLRHLLDRGAPVLAIHPRDLERGFWPTIVQLIEELLERGYEPGTLVELLDADDVEGVA